MSEILNLNKARKARSREQAKAQAAANRVSFGRAKGEKRAQKMETERAARLLDDAKREP